MSESMTFARGDHVRHAGRPEWGEGVVESAQTILHDGRKAQRLVVKFTHHGRSAVNTAVATLERSDGQTAGPPSEPQAGWLDRAAGAAETADRPRKLSELPEAATDPFASLNRRVRATAELYRFTEEPRSLMEWAIAQSGLEDPLGQYTRHELEQQFQLFQQAREAHLRDLLRTARRQGERLDLDALKQHPDPAIRQAVARVARSV